MKVQCPFDMDCLLSVSMHSMSHTCVINSRACAEGCHWSACVYLCVCACVRACVLGYTLAPTCVPACFCICLSCLFPLFSEL